MSASRAKLNMRSALKGCLPQPLKAQPALRRLIHSTNSGPTQLAGKHAGMCTYRSRVVHLHIIQAHRPCPGMHAVRARTCPRP